MGKLADGSGQDEKCKVAAEVQKQLPKETKVQRRAREKIIYDKPLEEQYTTIYTNNITKATVKVHQLADTLAEDYKDVLAAAIAFAKDGNSSYFLPIIDKNAVAVRKKVFVNYENKTKNPDLLVEGIYMDVKRPKKIENIVNNAIKASNQNAEAIIMDTEIAITENLARNKGKEILKNNEYEQKSVHFIINSNVITVNETGE